MDIILRDRFSLAKNVILRKKIDQKEFKMKLNSVFVLIVIYNKHCSESVTCRGLLNIKDINVILYDNSVSDYKNRDFCKKYKWVFMGGEGNDGLSKSI